jgi:hypothetical protein
MTQKNYAGKISLILTLFILYSSPARGTQTTTWTTSTFDEFQRGEAEQVLFTSTGEITLTPQVNELLLLEGNDLLVWTMIGDSQGNVYVGTGDQGRIFKITPEGEISLYFDSPEIGIISLAIDAEDNLYAGSTPDGLIYKITPEGSQTTFFMTEEHYVWSLVFGPNNILYAGTGEAGKIFKILPDGTGTVLYDSPQSHVMALVYDPQGWLYAGTEGKGITYKVELDGTAFALYHAKEEEIHSLALDSERNLYIAALTNKVYPKPQAPAPTDQQPTPIEKSMKGSTIYRISPQGTVSTIQEFEDTLIYAMLVDEKDQLLIGTDDQGSLYRVYPHGEYHEVFQVQDGNILAIAQTQNGPLYLGTGDAGAVYRLFPQIVDQGEYLSGVHDATVTAIWGKIFWRGTTQQIELFTRTGNTATPDDTWSQWSEALINKEGESIPSPPARFIQWKARLIPQEDQIPKLEEVSIAYLPNNLPPKIEEIAIYRALQSTQGEQSGTSRPSARNSNSSSSRSSSTESRNNKNGLKPPQYISPSHVALLWKASDPNEEKLLYTISLKGEQEAIWKVLEEDLKSPNYVLDTTVLPDGAYFMKITATDSPNNPPDRVLQAEKVSERFEVDNTPPQISIALNQEQPDSEVLLTVVVQDEFSRLKSAEYAVDAGDWVSIFPDDHVTDSRDEKYSIALEELTPDGHTLTFKATDRFDNIGVGNIQFALQEK